MIERLLGRAFEVLLGLLVLLFLIGCILGIARQGGPLVVTWITRAIPTVLAGTIVTLTTGIFFVGLGARLYQFLAGRGGRVGRDRDTHDRQARLTVRRPAQDVPAITAPKLPADTDPAISMEEE